MSDNERNVSDARRQSNLAALLKERNQAIADKLDQMAGEEALKKISLLWRARASYIRAGEEMRTFEAAFDAGKATEQELDFFKHKLQSAQLRVEALQRDLLHFNYKIDERIEELQQLIIEQAFAEIEDSPVIHFFIGSQEVSKAEMDQHFMSQGFPLFDEGMIH